MAQANSDASEQAKKRDAEKDSSINSLKKQLAARDADIETLNEKSEKLTDELAKAHLSNNELADERDKAQRALDDAPSIESQEKGFAIFRASDARMRALKKVAPKKEYNICIKAVNSAIKDGQFDKWTNPPGNISPKK